MTGTITAEFDAGLAFDSTALGVAWWKTVATEFHTAYPKAHLVLEDVSGNLVAYTTKLALQLRSASTSPDVIQINSQYLGEFGAAGNLLALNHYLTPSQAPYWSQYPANVRASDTIKGQVYGVDEGENIGAILYNKVLLKKAGIPLPWRPKTWSAILSAGEAVKSKDSGVAPIWLAAGTSTGPGGIAQGTGNLVLGTRDPAIFDAHTKKWVADSGGIKQVLSFYKTLYGKGLGAPLSEVFSPNAIGNAPDLMAQGKVAIAIGENWYPGAWALKGSGATWPAAVKDAGTAPIPTEYGQGAGSVTTLQGWAAAISRTSANAKLAWDLIQIMQQPANVISLANTAGFVPPEPNLSHAKAFVDFAPLQATIAAYLPSAKGLPTAVSGYAAWVNGIEEATQQLASKPSGTSVSSAAALAKSTIAGELGASTVE
ncbi:MAG: extracellular solute-binding protein [Acidimicrobiales bacterium]